MNKKEMRAQANAVEQAKGLAKWLEIDIEIKIFGFTILKYHFPPQSNQITNP